MLEIPNSKYRCQKCGCVFEIKMPRPVECIGCGHPYVDWVNSDVVLSALHSDPRWRDMPFICYRAEILDALQKT